MEKIVLASSNKNKIRELKSILPEYEILSLDDIGFTDEIEENGLTFEENALIKTEAVHKVCGLTVIADDSGLCVNALNGEPGIYSARYSGVTGADKDKSNNAKLIDNLKDKEDRSAYFACAGAVTFSDDTSVVVLATIPGKIGFEAKGDNGFGYDPFFIPDGYDITYAQMSDEMKNSLSHRKLAFEKIKTVIEEHYSK